MKHGTDTIESNTYSGAPSLTDFRAACVQQTLNIGPGDIRSPNAKDNLLVWSVAEYQSGSSCG
jgi:hypothetical protein